MKITTPLDFQNALDLYSPYTKAFIFKDGEVCCWRCARDNAELIKDAIEQEDSAPNWWLVVGVDNIEEDSGEHCANCNEKMYDA